MQQVDLSVASSCILRCLLWCSQQDDPTATAVVQHLLLEAVPLDSVAISTPLNKQLAMQLMLIYASKGTGKLASKVGLPYLLFVRQRRSNPLGTLIGAHNI